MSQGNYDPRFNQPNPFQPGQPQPGQPSPFSPQGGQGGFPGQGFPGQGFNQPPPSSGGAGKALLIVFGSLAAGFVLICGACCGGAMFLGQPPQATAAARQPFNLAAIPVPAFPERGTPSELVPGVALFTVKINGQTGGHYSPPGHGGTIFVYLPTGNHAPKSLPCLLITGAGTDLMEGVEFEEISGEEDAAEHLPYVRAGMAVVVYELDGSGLSDDADEQQMYEDFKASCAGLVNARNALEFTLQRCPEVNPAQLFTAGHSSAGTTSLLFAAHEPRIAGSIAYAPCSDVENFQPRFLIRTLAREFPGLIDFLCQSSPKTHYQRITCPVFLFHADDDSTIEVKETRDFANLLQQHNNQVTLQTVPTGEHYDSMIEAGIPAGIAWIRELTGK